MMTKGRVPRVALADAVHARLVEMILDGSLPSGAPMRVLHLAEVLGTSPTPVRECLARLEGEGLVERTPMKGYSVARPLDADELAMLMATRRLIEPEIAVAASAADHAALAERLTENIDRARATPVGTDFEEYRGYLELSAQFHAEIAGACPNRFLSEALAALPLTVHRFRLFGPEGVDDVEVSLDEHARIAAAVRSGDPEAVREAMAAHIDGVHTRSAKNLRERRPSS
jgi:DNA-binding GntR family transcriptional regulator